MIDYFRISGDGNFDLKLHGLPMSDQTMLKESMIRLVINGSNFDVKSCSDEKRFNKILIPSTRYLLRFERMALNYVRFFDLEKI